MTKYIEIGFGNRWFIRTEFEDDSGHEWETKGVVGPIRLQSVYFRMWLGHRVYIIDSRTGFECYYKDKRRFKLIFGIVSSEE